MATVAVDDRSDLAEALNRFYHRDRGSDDWGDRVVWKHGDDAEYLHSVRNTGTGGLHAEWRHSATDAPVVQINDAGLSAGDVTFVDLTVTGNTILGDAAGDSLTVNAAAEFNAAAVFDGTAEFNAAAQFDDVATFNSTLTANSTVNLGNGDADAITMIGLTTFRNAAGTTVQMELDAANNRVIVGSGTPLGSDTTPNLQVIGRLYVAPESANDLAIQVRRSSAASVGWSLGMTSDNDFVFKDDAGSETFRVGDTASTYQAKVTGDFNVTDDAVIAGDVSADRGVFGGTTFSSTEDLRVIGSSLFGGGITMSSGNIDVQSGTAGEMRIGALILNAASLTGSEKLRVNGAALFNGNLGFFSATPVGQGTVSGTVSGGTLAQLQSVMQQLLFILGDSHHNLINDTTT